MRSRVVAAAILLALGTCSAAAATRDASPRWPRNAERSFITSCDATSGGAVAFCRCELQWIERRYSYTQITSIYLHNTTRLRATLLRAAAACVQFAQ